jgi:hypothetical protein
MTLSRKAQNTLWCLGAVLVVVVAVAWFLATHVRVQRSLDMPRTGEARFNPLYALKVALQKDDVTVHARRRLQLSAAGDDEPAVALGARDTVVVYGDPRTLSNADVDGLLAWVERGGHLVVRAPADDTLLGRRAGVPLFDALGLLPMDEDSADCEDFRRMPLAVEAPQEAPDAAASDGDIDGLLFCDSPRFNLDGANPDYSWGDLDAGYVFARIAQGEGSVDVLADLDFMGTDALDQAASLDLTRQVLAPLYRQGTVHLVYASELPSLWAAIARHSWMAWLPLLLAFLAWLWLRMQRFGPELPAPDEERRSLLEHIVASGEHTYRYGFAHLLYGAVLDAFMARLRRRDPQAAALRGEPQLALLQARFPDVPAAQIRDALLPPFANDHASFRSRIATLIRLRNRL